MLNDATFFYATSKTIITTTTTEKKRKVFERVKDPWRKIKISISFFFKFDTGSFEEHNTINDVETRSG